ncbi:hypothetical protein KTU01_05290 [Kocuria turfanensis]|uniref:Uncharacterized protein n=1 Tax=Kocuria turfanensis TaxID=388357 RepID=A0A512I9N1_9MICC|nr:hypothetical protein KTU01_05290 [Kocuria turfanensis]
MRADCAVGSASGPGAAAAGAAVSSASAAAVEMDKDMDKYEARGRMIPLPSLRWARPGEGENCDGGHWGCWAGR